MFYKSAKKPSHTLAASAAINGVDLPAWVYAKPEPEAHATTPHDAAVITNDLLTRAEAARYLRVSDRTLSRVIRTGQLPASRIGRAVRIRQSDLLEMLDGKPSIYAGLGDCRE
jgi:excisionase family DNA binding protein